MARGDGGQLAELSAGVRGAAAVVDHVAPISLGRLILAGMVAGGVQYGWALQLSLLSPYSQARSVISSLFFDVCFARIYMQYGWLIFSRNFHGLIDL